MTSRRSRLKAVTNLPIRRKTLAPQGSADEATSFDNSTAQNANPCTQTPGVITLPNTQKNFEITEKETSENQCSVIVNYKCIDNAQVSENCTGENPIKKSNEPEIAETLDNSVNFSRNSHGLETDSSNNFVISSNSLKTNVISLPIIKRIQEQPCEKNQALKSPDEQNCIISNKRSKHTTAGSNSSNSSSSNNNNNNNNNNILEDGNKCYTILTGQNVTTSPLSEYTITPLTPCDNTYVGPNISDEYPIQEYEEVHIYTDIEQNELYIGEEPVIEARPSGSVIVRISNSDLENETNNRHINFESLSSEYLESNNEFRKSGTKKIIEFKNNLKGNDDCFKNPSLKTKYTQIENSVTSGSHVSTDLYSYRQGISSVRRKRSKCNDFTKKLADAKREFQKKYEKTKPDRSTLKMIDLIFYNPATNPMESKNKCEKKDTLVSTSEEIQNLLSEEKVDEPDTLDNMKSQMLDDDEMENVNKMPVPQLKIGLDGEIILDEKSIVIETTDAKKGREGLQNSVPVFEDRGCKVSYYRGKSRKSKDWTDSETKRFYKALNTIGPDFSLMQKYFPKRSRLELKNKFKREEKLNRNLIDKALNNPSEFDMTELEKDLAGEKEVEEEEVDLRLCSVVKRSARKPRVKSSVLSREMIESDEEPENGVQKSSDQNLKRLPESDNKKKKKEFDFVLHKLLLKDSEEPFGKFRKVSPTSPSAFRDLEQSLI